MSEYNGIKLPEFLGQTVAMDGVGVYARLNMELMGDIDAYSSRRIEGASLMLLSHGSVRIVQNGENIQVTAPASVDFAPGAAMAVECDDWSEVDLHLLYIDPSFLPELNISFTAITGEGVFERTSPVLSLSQQELTLLQRFFKLIRSVMEDRTNPVMTRHVLASLFSAFAYQLVMFWYKRLGEKAVDASVNPRRASYVVEFFKILHLNFMKERALPFYAGQLCISTKYLSMLVKEATGRSAADWIDKFVITEAKQMLRFSGKSIQQIAFSLNFVTQSAFGKYFKKTTGMSPSEFQRLKTVN